MCLKCVINQKACEHNFIPVGGVKTAIPELTAPLLTTYGLMYECTSHARLRILYKLQYRHINTESFMCINDSVFIYQ
jgi:hypothetical protein